MWIEKSNDVRIENNLTRQARLPILARLVSAHSTAGAHHRPHQLRAGYNLCGLCTAIFRGNRMHHSRTAHYMNSYYNLWKAATAGQPGWPGADEVRSGGSQCRAWAIPTMASSADDSGFGG
jgi:hypothetical protein